MHNPEKSQGFNDLRDLNLQHAVCSPSTSTICDLTESQDVFFKFQDDGESVQKDIQKASPYKISYDNYIGHKIIPLHRYKLIKWIQSQSKRHKYSREILALSCCYLDLFLSKTQQTNTSDLQDIALASMMIAIKIQGGLFPKLEKQFEIKKILMLETKICLKLNYFLYPTTYLKYLDDYTIAWNTFALKLNPLNQKMSYNQKQRQGSTRIKNLFEKAQYLNMSNYLNNIVSQSLKYDLAQLCFNLFFIETMINLKILEKTDVGFMNVVRNDEKECYKWIKQSYQSFHINQSIFNQFLRFEDNNLRFPSLKLEIGAYLVPFILLKIDNQLTMSPYNRIFQTYSPSALKDLDKIAKNKMFNQ